MHVNAMLSNIAYALSCLERRNELDENKKRKCTTDQRAWYEVEVLMAEPRLSSYMNKGMRGSTEQTFIPQEKAILIEECLDILTPQQRDAFIMVKVNRFPYETAAQIMNLKRTTIQNHVERASHKIETYLSTHKDQMSLPITG